MPTRQPIPDWLCSVPRHLGKPLYYYGALGSTIYGAFGSTVAKARKARKWTQAGLATRAGISRNYVSLIERGEAKNLSVQVLVRLAQALEVSEVDLFRLYLPQVSR